MLTGDSLFVGDIARPDLAVEREEGARGDLPLAPRPPARPARRGRGVARAPRRLAVRRARDGPQGRLDDRLRAHAQPAAQRGATRTRSSRARSPRSGRSRRTSAPSSSATGARSWARPWTSIPSPPRQVEQARAAGVLLVDVRTDLQFDDAHIPGAVCVTALRAGFGSKLAWLADREQDVVLVGRDDADARARRRPGRRGRHHPARRLPGRRDDELARGAAAGGGDRADHAAGAAGAPRRAAGARRAGALRVGRGPHPRLRARARTTTSHELPGELDPGRPVAAICASGQRSAVAVGLLRRLGARTVVHVAGGGVGTWGRLGGPLEQA